MEKNQTNKKSKRWVLGNSHFSSVLILFLRAWSRVFVRASVRFHKKRHLRFTHFSFFPEKQHCWRLSLLWHAPKVQRELREESRGSIRFWVGTRELWVKVSVLLRTAGVAWMWWVWRRLKRLMFLCLR